VPAWAWVVMAVEAVAIVMLIFLLVRERDLHALAEQRLSAARTYPAASRADASGSRYTGQESEYPTQRLDPPGGDPGAGR
jgi:hypothetical protein